MKLHRSKEWYRKSAEIEGDSEVGAGSMKPRREDVAWQLDQASKELSFGNLLNVMVHAQRAAAMALDLLEDQRGVQ